jgi:hypothetical protein
LIKYGNWDGEWEIGGAVWGYNFVLFVFVVLFFVFVWNGRGWMDYEKLELS